MTKPLTKHTAWLVASLMFLGLAAHAEPAIEDGLVLIHGASFQMGSPQSELERDPDEALHAVSVADFWLAPQEVTQKSYAALMGRNPSEHVGENLPVENVTWYDAIRYCNALSKARGLTPCYEIRGTEVSWNRAANGYRLPLESEWEYAARAGTRTPFHFGTYVYDKDANCYNAYGYNNDASGNWVNGYLERPVPVDRHPANAFGLRNMHGNVSEWTWNWYGPYGKGSETGPDAGNYKVARGGGWNDFPKHIRSAYRSALPADVPFVSTGLRVARSAVPGQGTAVSRVRTAPRSGKVLIAYFSQTGNAAGLAKKIQAISGYDIVRIERAAPYAATYNCGPLYAEALEEYRKAAVPPLKTLPSVQQYDVILLGYCNWWASIPAPVRTFLKQSDLRGKVIVPFCSMGGGRFGQTVSAIAKLAPDSTLLPGLDVTYASYDSARIQRWLKGIDERLKAMKQR